MTNGWISNDPRASALLRAADAAYERAKGNASNMPLAQKVVALSAAKQIREAAYNIVNGGMECPDCGTADCQKNH